MTEHRLVNDTLLREGDGIIARCVCGWVSRAHFSSLSASANFKDHQEREAVRDEVRNDPTMSPNVTKAMEHFWTESDRTEQEQASDFIQDKLKGAGQ